MDDPQHWLVIRAQGCLLGQLAGDALGSAVEFRDARSLAASYPGGLHQIIPSPVWDTIAGQPTDDSELALALARTLARHGFNLERIAGAYADWSESRPFDVGSTVGPAVRAMSQARARGDSMVEATRKVANYGSEANGALMRESPLAIWGYSLPAADLARMAMSDAALTHPNQVCQDASAAYIVALAATIRDALSGEQAYEVAVQWDKEHGQSPAVTEALRRARDSAPADFSYHAGHVPLALQNAFYQAMHARSLEEGVVSTVMGGGDTDTNAAIAGALLGAISGLPAIPTQWRDAVLNCRPEAGKPGVHKPRPQTYWPADALDLAEQLLKAPH